MFKLSSRSEERMGGVDPRLIEIAKLAITLTVIDFGIPRDGGVRTAERQYELFKDKKSKADGYKKLSKHQSKKALDVFAYVDGKASWNTEHLAMIAAAMMQAASILGYQLEWGGLWKNFSDMPHFQLLE